jgi:glucose-6-phosphate 1-epimerase
MLPLPPSVRLVTGSGSLPRLDVSTPFATAQIYLHGAHVAAWHPSHTASPVLWLSAQSLFQPDKPIRGGVPICFPWFGPHASDTRAPAHGFARLAEWTLTRAIETPDGAVRLALTLEPDASTTAAWPCAFRLTHRIVIGSRLTMTLEVENPLAEPLVFEAALHSYFAVEDIEAVSIDGLERAAYLDKVGGSTWRTQDDAPIRFRSETDRVYLDTSAACVIRDERRSRRIVVAKAGSQSTIVWNPWIDKARAMPDFGDQEWREMVCVETGNVGEAAVRLEPGGRHEMQAEISVEPL